MDVVLKLIKISSIYYLLDNEDSLVVDSPSWIGVLIIRSNFMVEKLVPGYIVGNWGWREPIPSNVVKISVPTEIIDGKEVTTNPGYFLVTFKVR